MPYSQLPPSSSLLSLPPPRSEFFYTSILGLLGGALYGFVAGYAGALGASARLLVHGTSSLAGAGARVVMRALKALKAGGVLPRLGRAALLMG